MDFRKLSKAIPASNNGHGFNATELPALNSPNLLEALVPGYSIISGYASAYLDLDISTFVTLGLICVAVTKGGQFMYAQLERLFRALFMSSVYIDEHDDLFDQVMAWLAAHQEYTSRNRSMRAKTQRGSQKGGTAEEQLDASAEDALDENGMFNYNKWTARTPPRYEPYYGRQFVWHNGNIFWFTRKRRPNEGQRMQVSFNNASDDDLIQLDCIGRNIEPIKDLLRSVRVWSVARISGTTVIRHPTPKDRARFGGAWSKTSARPSRPMDTVILDHQQKSMIINDMNEYLHPLSPKWYATRGIPYRRGYLFHGPPGTGKTSLSFALAGIFGLEVYAISLQEPTLTEGDLLQLFNGLPRRCIVLLEDVDAAGLTRDGTDESNKATAKRKQEEQKGTGKTEEDGKGTKATGDTQSTRPKKDDEYTLRDLAKELKAVSAPQRGGRAGPPGNDRGGGHTQPGTGISLSGLLNAIDGVASHEGRVLIMTTNHPDQLDAALVRPGRVDRKVEFRLALKDQIQELFVRMYAASEIAPSSTLGVNGSPSIKDNQKIDPGNNTKARIGDEDSQLSFLSRAELEDLAASFATHVPDDTFTPAEVQNLLMRHKKAPRTAVESVEAWTKEVLAEKEKLSMAKGADAAVDPHVGAV
ncbi:hypothetical protein D0865_05254 [Hortaea werneckii]|uniref:AAA+ ATPase domain-containing protein n=1 Tax=Hortaea werneckii TaxID=91943 RepID=A0A3M7CMT8_HORWE|nr:hypothetical protein D0865_05254 [Hortaea werneckii]